MGHLWMGAPKIHQACPDNFRNLGAPVAEFGQHLANLGQLGCTNFGQLWSRFGQIWPTSAKLWPSLAAGARQLLETWSREYSSGNFGKHFRGICPRTGGGESLFPGIFRAPSGLRFRQRRGGEYLSE